MAESRRTENEGEIVRRTARLTAISALVLGGLLGAAPSASADHHFSKVSEVYPGATGTESNEFIELQMYADGQTMFTANNARIVGFEPGGSTSLSPGTLTPDPTFGFSQRTVLIGTATADTQFGVTSDYALPAGNNINPAGGAVCFRSNAFPDIDCVSWGSFSNVFSLPVGNPESPGGIPNTNSIRRSLAPGCSTLLEEGDDTNNSAPDFAPASPTPRPNNVTPTETACPEGGGGGEGGVTMTTPKLCKVPALKGLKTRAARDALTAADCAAEVKKKETNKRKRRGKVLRQKLEPGATAPPATVVPIVVGKKPKG